MRFKPTHTSQHHEYAIGTLVRPMRHCSGTCDTGHQAHRERAEVSVGRACFRMGAANGRAQCTRRTASTFASSGCKVSKVAWNTRCMSDAHHAQLWISVASLNFAVWWCFVDVFFRLVLVHAVVTSRPSGVTRKRAARSPRKESSRRMVL